MTQPHLTSPQARIALALAAISLSLPSGAAQAWTPLESSRQAGGKYRLVTQFDEQTNTQPPYTLTLYTPALQTSGGGDDARTKAFNTRVVDLVQAQIDDVKKAAADSSAITETAGMTSSLWLSHTDFAVTSKLVSVRLDVSPYSAGAAHPNQYSIPINFDVQSGALLKLDDLFKPGSNYLAVISAYCVAQLKKRDVFEFPEGAEPTAENYRNWNATAKGLVITFDSYQVAPYVAGPQEVLVPYRALARVLKAKSAVSPWSR